LIVAPQIATFSIMNTPSQVPAFDAFGDRATSEPARRTTNRARSAAVAIFWSVATLLVAGRVYQQGAPAQPHAMEMASR